jgi:hypothetical protein
VTNGVSLLHRPNDQYDHWSTPTPYLQAISVERVSQSVPRFADEGLALRI